MKTRQVIKIGIDISMTVLLFILMAFHYVGLQWHEVTGAVMLVLFILHHILMGTGTGHWEKGNILPAEYCSRLWTWYCSLICSC